MYEKVRRRSRREKNGPLVTAIAICLAVVVFCLVMAYWWGFRYRAKYSSYVSDLSRSTVYAYNHDSLIITMDGESYPAARENIHEIYSRITNVGYGRVGTPPDRAPDALLEYGNFTRLELWSIVPENTTNTRASGLLIRFTDHTGETYAYDTDRLELALLPLEQRENAR